jgi:Zn-dependent peptidase ImmA (M78 family)
MSRTTAIRRAIQILSELGVAEPPVDVFSIAEQRGVRLRAGELGDEISGLLMVKDGSSTIGYARSHSKNRQRFTVAHELGHHELHRKHELLIDKGPMILYRDGASSSGDDPLEKEANAFAAELLMPEAMVKAEIAARGLRLADEKEIELLAQIFSVSITAMVFRLVNLKIIESAIS